MLNQLVDHSPDLKKLRDDGYEVEIRGNYLLINNVPYLNSKKEIKYGTLASELTLRGDITAVPSTHVVLFVGEYPCNKDGIEISQIRHQPINLTLDDGLVANYSFSNKPTEGYRDYYEKMTRYIEIISHPAESLGISVTARTFKVIESQDEGSVFNYIDTSSSRAGISSISDKLKPYKIGIIGLGGTGSYVLDLVAKTPVNEIHLFDGDEFLQHNAFRSPGAPSVEELNKKQKKVVYLKELYSKMHKRIFSHEVYIDSSNLDQLLGMDFVFMCLDKGNCKKIIVEKLEEAKISFIDVGMGIDIVDKTLIGIVRVTTSTDKKREHVRDKNRISFSEDAGNDAYSQNTQIADLNALNAALAVIKWKKLCGFYQDLENENHSTYTLNVNMLLNDDQHSP